MFIHIQHTYISRVYIIVYIYICTYVCVCMFLCHCVNDTRKLQRHVEVMSSVFLNGIHHSKYCIPEVMPKSCLSAFLRGTLFSIKV